MKQKMLPLNLSLMVPTPEQLRTIRPVTTLDIFDGPGGNFHEDGLFSTTTFGRVGDDLRYRRFGYIHLKLPILHPVIYSRLIKLKGLYQGILAGQEYAKWDEESKDFIRSNELEGQTGYSFFLSKWDVLSPSKTGSSIRDLRVNLIEKYRDLATMRHLLVLPAGLRDLDMGSDGRPSMDEVNELYQSVLMMVRNFPERVSNSELSIYDHTRYTLTLKILELYEHFERLISGKRGFIQAKYASRRVFNGTRNVLTSLDSSTHDLDTPARPRFNDSVVGLYQASKSLLPKTIYRLKTGIVGEVFNGGTNRVELVNPKTLELEWVEVATLDLDRWSTEEGLEQIVEEQRIPDNRHLPVMVGDHYLALVYKDDKSNYRVFRDIQELPDTLDRRHVHPITYVELIYLSGLDEWYSNCGFITRYPIENPQSSYPTRLYVKTTVVGELRYELDMNWERTDTATIAKEYPILEAEVTPKYVDSVSVQMSRLSSLGADFDGDTVSYSSVYSKESITEINDYFKTRAAYVKAGGGLNFSSAVHTVNLVLSFMTRPEPS